MLAAKKIKIKSFGTPVGEKGTHVDTIIYCIYIFKKYLVFNVQYLEIKTKHFISLKLQNNFQNVEILLKILNFIGL